MISVTCLWSAIATADPPIKPGSEVINPWAPAAVTYIPWSVPHESAVVDPWRGAHNTHRTSREPFIVDPWHARTHSIPTAAFPPLHVVDPWTR